MAFDVITPAKLGQGAVGITPFIFYTVPANTRTFVKNIDICNTTLVSKSITGYLVPIGDSPTADNTLIPGITVPANGMFQWAGVQLLNAGDTIQLMADVVGCTANISGAEAT
jgi:hypothetical protein